MNQIPRMTDVGAIPDSLFLDPQHHVFQAAVALIELAANVDADQFHVSD